MYISLAAWGYAKRLSSYKSSRQVAGRGRKAGGLRSRPGYSPWKLGWIEPKSTITCMVLEVTTNDKYNVVLRSDEFRGSFPIG
ncbi:hypothetical protein TNCV_1740911 [Trichonephila clavipes]|uniref:Uncharacterized protein n=1 Tax=Trichonephila clavipes TaxID=2585209 RepID=A0A8X6RBQ1_TRICX|nr:hypothetical protein TNCV_1740911 [Trichonephila clavipes]